jgi:hypothetical protein
VGGGKKLKIENFVMITFKGGISLVMKIGVMTRSWRNVDNLLLKTWHCYREPI